MLMYLLYCCHLFRTPQRILCLHCRHHCTVHFQARHGEASQGACYVSSPALYGRPEDKCAVFGGALRLGVYVSKRYKQLTMMENAGKDVQSSCADTDDQSHEGERRSEE